MPLNWRRPYSPGPLTEAEADQYWYQGYVIKRSCLSPEADLKPCLQAIERRVDGLATKLLAARLISDPAPGLDVFSRLTALEAQFPEASVLIHKDGALPPEFAALWSHTTLLAIARQLLGPDVGGHPSWNLRAKTPQQAAGVVPWHQDTAYCHPESWSTLQVTAWVPLLDVTVANGCMQLLRGGHLAGKTVRHTGAVGDTWYVSMDESAAEAELGLDFERDVVTAEMAAGDVLLFNNLTPHRSLDNTSSSIRWSLDLRWQHPLQPAGAYGLKPVIPMCRADDTGFVIPWQGWVEVDKKSGAAQPPDLLAAAAAAGGSGSWTSTVDGGDPAGTGSGGGGGEAAAAGAAGGAGGGPELSTILVGPWLDNWEIVHENKHTRAWQALKQAQALAQQQPQQQQQQRQ